MELDPFPVVFVDLFVEVGVSVEGPCLLADLVIGLVLAPTGKGVARSSSLGPLSGSPPCLAGWSSTWIGSKIVPSYPICIEEVSRAIPKENLTPFFGGSRNFPLSDFLSLCGVERLLGLVAAGS